MGLRLTGGGGGADASLTALLTNLAANTRGNRVSFVGDSITEGPQALSPYNFIGNAHGRYWDDWWTFLTFQRVRSVGNWALGSTTIEDARDTQMRQLLDRGLWPDSVVLAVGTNNLADTTAVAWAKFQTLLRRVAMLGIRPILTTIPPNTTRPAQVIAWNANIRALATLTGLPLVERNTPIKGATEDVWGASMTDDGTHPNDAGHRAIGVAVAADATLAGKFDYVMPALDRTTPATGASTDTFNLAGTLWNTDTGWDYTGWTDPAHTWGNATFAGDPVGGNVRQLNLTGFGTIKADVACKADAEVMMLFNFGGSSSPMVSAQPRGSAADLGPAFMLTGFPTVGGTGVLHAIVKAPPGMDTIRLTFTGFAFKVGALTVRKYGVLG